MNEFHHRLSEDEKAVLAAYPDAKLETAGQGEHRMWWISNGVPFRLDLLATLPSRAWAKAAAELRAR